MAVVINELTVVTPAQQPAEASVAQPTEQALPTPPAPQSLAAALERQDRQARRVFAH